MGNHPVGIVKCTINNTNNGTDTVVIKINDTVVKTLDSKRCYCNKHRQTRNGAK